MTKLEAELREELENKIGSILKHWYTDRVMGYSTEKPVARQIIALFPDLEQLAQEIGAIEAGKIVDWVYEEKSPGQVKAEVVALLRSWYTGTGTGTGRTQ